MKLIHKVACENSIKYNKNSNLKMNLNLFEHSMSARWKLYKEHFVTEIPGRGKKMGNYLKNNSILVSFCLKKYVGIKKK